MVAAGLKTAITFFNKFISSTSDKEKTVIKIEVKDKVLSLSSIKNSLGFRYSIPLEEDMPKGAIAVFNSEFQKLMKNFSAKDEIQISFDNWYLTVEKGDEKQQLKGKAVQVSTANYEDNGEVLIEYFNPIFKINKDFNKKTVCDLSNQMFFSLNNNQLELANTNEAVVIYGASEAEVKNPVNFAIPHMAVNSLLKFISLYNKNYEILKIKTTETVVSFSFDTFELIIPKKTDNKALSILRAITEKDFEIQETVGTDVLETYIQLPEEEQKIPFEDIKNIRVQKSFMDSILEEHALACSIPVKSTDPLLFRLEDPTLRILLLPIDKEAQK